MNSLLDNVYLELAAKCDKRTEALLKVIDALEDIKDALPPVQNAWTRRDWKIFSAYKRALEQIETTIGHGGETNGKL